MQEIRKAGFVIARKIYDDTGWFRNLLTMSGLHDEAAKITEAMILIESVGGVLQEMAKAEPAERKRRG